MGKEEFEAIAKEAISHFLLFNKETVWGVIINYMSDSNYPEEELTRWTECGDGDIIVDKMFEKILDAIKEL